MDEATPCHAFVTTPSRICHSNNLPPCTDLCSFAAEIVVRARVPHSAVLMLVPALWGNFFARCNFSGDELRLTNANHNKNTYEKNTLHANSGSIGAIKLR